MLFEIFDLANAMPSSNKEAAEVRERGIVAMRSFIVVCGSFEVVLR